MGIAILVIIVVVAACGSAAAAVRGNSEHNDVQQARAESVKKG